MTPKAPFSPESMLACLRDMESPAAQDPTLKARVHSRLTVSLLGQVPVVTSTCPPPLGGELTAPLSHLSTASSVPIRSGKGLIFAWLAPAFLTGTVAGVLADRWYQRSHAPTVAVSRAIGHQPVAHVAPTLVPTVVAIVETVSEERTRAVTATIQTNATSSPAASVSTMAAERQLLDAARTALARGEPRSGVVFLTKHAKQFPKGTLAEEREALHVRILVAMGDNDSAVAHAESFREHYPNSIFMPVIERAKNSITQSSIPRRNTDTDSKQ